MPVMRARTDAMASSSRFGGGDGTRSEGVTPGRSAHVRCSPSGGTASGHSSAHSDIDPEEHP